VEEKEEWVARMKGKGVQIRRASRTEKGGGTTKNKGGKLERGGIKGMYREGGRKKGSANNKGANEEKGEQARMYGGKGPVTYVDKNDPPYLYCTSNKDDPSPTHNPKYYTLQAGAGPCDKRIDHCA